jgi:hypothetical protein
MELNQFDLYENFEDDGSNSSSFELIWTHLTQDKTKLNRFRIYLKSELKRLKRIKNINFLDGAYNYKKDNITDYEWSNINQYIDANIIAMSIALDDITPPIQDKQIVPTTPDVMQKIVGNGNHYDTLLETEVDDMSYHKTTCDNRDQFGYIGYWDTEHNIQSSYYPGIEINYCESFWFNKKPDEINVCINIDIGDQVPEMCSAFRPYYTEYTVHMTARYIKSLKRVLFIGSGGTNSMLLNELLLKYNSSIELIVGIELDQTIIRKNFKHFKTDPYFNDERV